MTEDADLGLRFARFGYLIEAIDSATYEDAPVQFANWLGQRTRWMKGWMQTLAVFLRTPRRHLRRMGWRRALAAFCLHHREPDRRPAVRPFYGLRLAYDLWFGDLLAPATVERLIYATLSLTIASFGALVFVLHNLIGMRRRGLRASPVLLLAPAYLLLLSYAAWRALWELTRQPFVSTHTPRPVAAGDQAASDFTNFPASASAMRARVLSTP